MSRDTFDQEKAALLRFARVLEKAQSPAALGGLLMFDVGSPYRSLDPLAVMAAVENMGSAMARLMADDLAAPDSPDAEVPA